MALTSIKLLDKVIHNGRFRHAGDVIELEAEAAEKLIDLGIAEAESAAKKLIRKGKGKSSDDKSDDGDESSDSSDSSSQT